MFKILNPGDGRTCSKCRQWIGRTISDSDGTYDEWMRSGSLHPNCRCSLIPVGEHGRVDRAAQDYMQRKAERIRELVKFKIGILQHPFPADTIMVNIP